MGQKVNPQGFRLGVTQEPTSYWFAKNRHYSQLVLEDHFLRSSIYKKFPSAGIAAIYIERQVDTIKIDISSARPRSLLGSFSKDQQLYTGIQDLRELLKTELQQYRLSNLLLLQKKGLKPKKPKRKLESRKSKPLLENQNVPGNSDNTFGDSEQRPAKEGGLYQQNENPTPLDFSENERGEEMYEVVDPKELVAHISIHIIKLPDPDTSAACLAESIVEQLEKRIPFRRAMKQAITKAQNASVKGVKIQISGRLNGAEIARSEWILKGRVPLHTLRAKVQYDSRAARTTYGLLGIKVWVFTEA